MLQSLKRQTLRVERQTLKAAYRTWRTWRQPTAPALSYGRPLGVLLRGESLARAGSLSFLNDFIIVNTFDRELKHSAVASLLRGKSITHLVNSVERILSPSNLFKFE